MNIGEHIRKIRELKRISQKDLAEKSELSVNGLLNYEKNYREPTYTTLLKLAMLLKVKVSVLTDWLDNAVDAMDLSNFLRGLYPDEYYYDKDTTEHVKIGGNEFLKEQTIELPKFLGDNDARILSELLNIDFDSAISLMFGEIPSELDNYHFYSKFANFFNSSNSSRVLGRFESLETLIYLPAFSAIFLSFSALIVV